MALSYNLVALPPFLSYEQGATIGVAFVAAILALGVSLGINFQDVLGGPDLFHLVRAVDSGQIPEDVRRESLEGIEDEERPKSGDWLAIWGGETCGRRSVFASFSLFFSWTIG